MKQKPTPEELIQQKLMETSVPSAAEGWTGMRSLLENQPSPKTIHRKGTGWLKKASAAAAILLLGGLTGWWMTDKTTQPKNTPLVVSPSRQDTSSLLPKANTNHTPVKTKELIYKREPVTTNPNRQATPPSTIKANPALATNQRKISSTSSSLHADLATFSPIPMLPFSKTSIENKKMTFTEEDLSLKQKLPAKDIPLPEKATALLSKIKEKENNIRSHSSSDSRKFHIAIRLNANGGSSFGHSAENYSPVLKGTPVEVYPSVYINKRISSKLALQAGLAVASPVDVPQRQFSKSVSNPLRAMEADVADSRDQITINRLYYADIPLTVQYHLTDKLLIGSGFQLSILEKIVGEKQRVDYDRRNTIMFMEPSQPDPQILSNQGEAANGIRPVDFRWLASLRYRFAKQWEASIQYQYGLTDISENKTFLNQHKDRNSVISAGIGFLIR